MRTKIKEKIYNLIAHSGIWFLGKFFPEYFASEPLRPTDRYIEYPWAIGNLPSPPAKVLDVGCSGSIFPLLLKALGYETYGIDIRQYYPQGKFFFTKSDVSVNLYQDDFFDVITAISVVEHIGLKGRYSAHEDMEGDVKALQEIYRILKPEGLFLMTVPIKLELKITRNHKIYNQARIDLFLHRFNHYEYKFVASPEADYNLALIKAVK